MNATASIIIGFTPFHLLPMLEILAKLENDIYVFHPMASNRRVMETNREFSFIGNCENLSRSRISKNFRAARDIDRIMRDYASTDIYIPHPFNPLANYAFFHAGSNRRFIYQDGILNYYDAVCPHTSRKLRILQKAKAAAAGMTYTTYAGHLSGVDSLPIAGGFFTHPSLIVRADRFSALQRLHLRAREHQPRPGTGTLFLDQPIDAILGKERARELRHRTVDYVNGLGGHVFYKPHYSQGREASFDATWSKLEPRKRALPAEWLVDELGVANVVSFCTSALANISMSHESVTCHATAASLFPVSVDGRRTTLAEVLLGLGVKVVK